VNVQGLRVSLIVEFSFFEEDIGARDGDRALEYEMKGIVYLRIFGYSSCYPCPRPVLTTTPCFPPDPPIPLGYYQKQE
jgi:hypothetical protein